MDEKERILVGVNEYTIEGEEVPVKLLRIDPKVEEDQVARLREVRRTRDNRRVKEVLDELHAAAGRDENLMPIIIEAVKAYATLGEICDVLRKVYGEYRELIVI